MEGTGFPAKVVVQGLQTVLEPEAPIVVLSGLNDSCGFRLDYTGTTARRACACVHSHPPLISFRVAVGREKGEGGGGGGGEECDRRNSLSGANIG